MLVGTAEGLWQVQSEEVKGEERAFFTADEGHRIMRGCGFSVSSNLSTYTSNLVLGWDSRRPSRLDESMIPITSVDRGKIAIDTR